jgi:PAS domain S-box-containing protein
MTETEFQLLEAIGALVVVVGVDGTIVYWNRACSELTGYALDEVRGRQLWDLLLVADEVERVRALFTELGTRDRGSPIANYWVTKTGERRWIAWSHTKVMDRDGCVQYFIKTGIDATEHKLAEDRLSAIAWQRGLLAEVGVAAARAATLDYDAALSWVARLAVRDLADCCLILGLDRDGNARRLEVMHRDPEQTRRCMILQHTFADVLGSVLDSGQPRLMAEITAQYLESIAEDPAHLRALQELAPRSFIAVPLARQRKLLGALLLVALPPSRMYGQEDLQFAEEFAMRAALAVENTGHFEENRRVTQDMLEANEQLVETTIRAQESAAAAESAKAETEERERQLHELAELREMFIGIVGHDLRNPLAAIGMSAAVLLRDAHLDARGQQAVERINRASRRMSRMVAQLLDFTRARLGGGFPIERIPTDLREVCSSVVDEFDAPIQLEFEGDVTGAWDPDRLVEALSNLVGNALEHATPGTCVGVTARADAAGQVVVEVRNAGEPIPAQLLPTIFEPFHRRKPHEASAAGNLGLGLFIARQIVLAHGGTLDARSADGTTIFSMQLPR